MDFRTHQLRAAYLLKAVHMAVQSMPDEDQAQIRAMYRYDALFECVHNFQPGGRPAQQRFLSAATVAQNIVQRGLPTLAPAFMENMRFADKVDKGAPEQLKKSLAVHDPGYAFDPRRRYYQKTPGEKLVPAEANNTEIGFLCALSRHKTLSAIAQHLEIQKPLETVVRHPNTSAEHYTDYARYCLDESLEEVVQKAREQRLDFALELPALSETKSPCVAVELDGLQHAEAEQRVKDGARDAMLKELYWNDTVRIGDISATESYAPALERITADYRRFLASPAPALECVVIPLRAAQVARAFLRLVASGDLRMEQPELTIAVTACTDERVVLCGVKNAVDLLYNLCTLKEGKPARMATVRLLFRESGKAPRSYLIDPVGEDSAAGGEGLHGVTLAPPRKKERKAALILEEHLNQRLFAFNPETAPERTVWLYSAYGEDTARQFGVADFVPYKITEASRPCLRYFLRNIFGNESFKDKQEEIVSHALAKNNVIGLLPTGGGKSLTYQMAILLQPGLGLVVTPIISLMKDQVRNLQERCIDACATINADVPSEAKRRRLRDMLNRGYLFMYVSPERLQMRAFVEGLEAAQCVRVTVFDEAHCVSQWGHDFRTPYLRSGNIISRRFTKSIMMALTGTASCSVITDITRELNMSGVKVVIPKTFERQELRFKVIKSTIDQSLKQRIKDGAIEDAIAACLRALAGKGGDGQNDEELLRNFFERSEGKYGKSGLIFNPFARGESSVEAIAKKLRDAYKGSNVAVDIYHGKLDAKVKDRAQEKFIGNETAILVATRAFGMGIDKPNVRFTIHTTIPESIESFYQEAGRAGRDRAPAVNAIIAPPLSTEFESIDDRRIFQYFLGLSFPDKKSFLDQVHCLTATKYIKYRIDDRLLGDMRTQGGIREDKLGFQGKGYLYVDVRNQSGRGSGGSGKNSVSCYDVAMQPDGALAFTPTSQAAKPSTSGLFEMFMARVKASMQGEAARLPMLTAGNLRQSLWKGGKHETASIDDAVRTLRDNETQDCCIGLKEDTLENPLPNPVDAILDILRRRKQEQSKANLSYSPELQGAWCAERDRAKGQKRNYDFDRFYPLFVGICKENGLRIPTKEEYNNLVQPVKDFYEGKDFDNIQDKILYYIGLLGVYTDYERYYSPDYVKITMHAVDAQSLRDHICDHIAAYETRNYVKRKVKSDVEAKVGTTGDIVRTFHEAVKYLVDYSYTKIRNYRETQTRTMYECVKAAERGDEAFTRELYKYFESKYSDELSGDMRKENTALPWHWIQKIQAKADNGTDHWKDELSHLRLSALKVQAEYPNAYTPFLLCAYASLKDDTLDIRSGIDAYIRGCKNLGELYKRYSPSLRQICEDLFKGAERYFLEEVDRILAADYASRDNAQYLVEFRAALTKQLGQL